MNHKNKERDFYVYKVCLFLNEYGDIYFMNEGVNLCSRVKYEDELFVC